MRVRVHFASRVRHLDWPVILAPGRALAYGWLERGNPDLAAALHSRGMGPHGMVPFGHGAPVFPEAKRRSGMYAAGGRGYAEFGSPVQAVVEAWAKALATETVLDWGGAAFHVSGVEVVEAPGFGEGTATWRTSTPVVLKGSGRDASGVRKTRQAWLYPGDEEYIPYLTHNLRRKATTLGVEADVEVAGVSWAGPRRSFYVKNGHKPGAAVEVTVRGAPEVLQAIWCWGLGSATSSGFGWVRHD